MTNLPTALFVFAFLAALSPGPNSAVAAATAARFGFRRTLPHLMGSTIGYVIVLIGAGAGLAGVMQSQIGLIVALKVLGCIALLFLAWRIAHGGAVFASDGRGRPVRSHEALLLQVINPKPWLTALIVTTQFLPGNTGWGPLLAVGATFLVAVLVSTALWACAGQSFSRWLCTDARLRIFNGTIALCVLASALMTFAV